MHAAAHSRHSSVCAGAKTPARQSCVTGPIVAASAAARRAAPGALSRVTLAQSTTAPSSHGVVPCRLRTSASKTSSWRSAPSVTKPSILVSNPR